MLVYKGGLDSNFTQGGCHAAGCVELLEYLVIALAYAVWSFTVASFTDTGDGRIGPHFTPSLPQPTPNNTATQHPRPVWSLYCKRGRCGHAQQVEPWLSLTRLPSSEVAKLDLYRRLLMTYILGESRSQ
jgi:hypothetical protein